MPATLQRGGQSPPLAERAEPVQRLGGGDARLDEIPLVFRVLAANSQAAATSHSSRPARAWSKYIRWRP